MDGLETEESEFAIVPLEVGDEVETFEEAADEITQAQEPMQVESKGEEVAQVVDKEGVNAQVPAHLLAL